MQTFNLIVQGKITPFCWIYAREGYIRGWNLLFCNPLNDVLVTGLYLWLSPPSSQKNEIIFISVHKSSKYLVIKNQIPEFVNLWICDFDNKNIDEPSQRTLNFFFKMGWLVPNSSYFEFFFSKLIYFLQSALPQANHNTYFFFKTSTLDGWKMLL